MLQLIIIVWSSHFVSGQASSLRRFANRTYFQHTDLLFCEIAPKALAQRKLSGFLQKIVSVE